MIKAYGGGRSRLVFASMWPKGAQKTVGHVFPGLTQTTNLTLGTLEYTGSSCGFMVSAAGDLKIHGGKSKGMVAIVPQDLSSSGAGPSASLVMGPVTEHFANQAVPLARGLGYGMAKTFNFAPVGRVLSAAALPAAPVFRAPCSLLLRGLRFAPCQLIRARAVGCRGQAAVVPLQSTAATCRRVHPPPLPPPPAPLDSWRMATQIHARDGHRGELQGAPVPRRPPARACLNASRGAQRRPGRVWGLRAVAPREDAGGAKPHKRGGAHRLLDDGVLLLQHV